MTAVHLFAWAASACCILGCSTCDYRAVDAAFSKIQEPQIDGRLPAMVGNYTIQLMCALPEQRQLAIVVETYNTNGTFKDQLVALVDLQLSHCEILMRTFGRVLAMAAAPDGKTIALHITDNHGAEASDRIVLVDVDRSKEPMILSRDIKEGFCLKFSRDGRLLAATSDVNHVVFLWDLAEGKSCTISGQLESRIWFTSGEVLGHNGDCVDLTTWPGGPCPTWRHRDLDWWDDLCFDEKHGVAYAGVSGHKRFLGSVPTPSKVTVFEPQRQWLKVKTFDLPYPECDEDIDRVLCISDERLVVAENNRIVIHDSRTMSIRAVLGSSHIAMSNVDVLPQENMVVASSGDSVLEWTIASKQLSH